MFKKGDKVICVDDNVNCPDWIVSGAIKNGRIYTIRDVETSEYSNSGVRVEEVKQKINPFLNIEYTFCNFRFRKLWDDKTLKEFNIKNKEKEPVGI